MQAGPELLNLIKASKGEEIDFKRELKQLTSKETDPSVITANAHITPAGMIAVDVVVSNGHITLNGFKSLTRELYAFIDGVKLGVLSNDDYLEQYGSIDPISRRRLNQAVPSWLGPVV